MWEGRRYTIYCFQNSRILSLQVLLPKRTLSSPIIPANVNKLTIYIAKCMHCYLCFTLRLPRCRWWRSDCQRIVTFKCYGAIMARLFFDATEIKSLWCSTLQSYQRLSIKTPSILVSFITYLGDGVFPLNFIWKTIIRTVWTPRTICTWHWVIVCQGLTG